MCSLSTTVPKTTFQQNKPVWANPSFRPIQKNIGDEIAFLFPLHSSFKTDYCINYVINTKFYFMAVEYDKYYQTEDLFGKAYPELLDFYSQLKERGRLLDVGCGQGRDAIPLARMGYNVTGIDHSIVGIKQMNKIAEKENLSLIGRVEDLNEISEFDQYDHILLDSMFHFGKKEKEQELSFLNRLFNESHPKTIITICIQDMVKKVNELEKLITNRTDLELIHKTELMYKYEDQESGHISETKYKMIVLNKP